MVIFLGLSFSGNEQEYLYACFGDENGDEM